MGVCIEELYIYFDHEGMHFDATGPFREYYKTIPLEKFEDIIKEYNSFKKSLTEKE